MHGGSSASQTLVELSLDIHAAGLNKEVAVTVSDSGIPFNCVEALPKIRPSSLDEAEPGGLGLAIIKGLSSRLAYEFRGGRNFLTFAIQI